MAQAVSSLLITALLLSVPTLAGAEESKDQNANMAAQTNAIQPASVFGPDESIDLADVVKVYRQIGDFVIGCDYRLSNKRYACSVSATMQVKDEFVTVAFVGLQNGEIVTQVTAPADLDVAKGFVLLFEDVAKIVPQKDWQCDNRGCVATFPFTGTFQVGLLRSKKLSFTLNQTSKANLVSGSFDLTSLKVAFDVAANGPFQTIKTVEPITAIPVPKPKGKSAKNEQLANAKKNDSSKSKTSKPKPGHEQVDGVLRATQP